MTEACNNSCCFDGVLTTGNPCPTCRGSGTIETYRVKSRSLVSGHEATHPIGGHFGAALKGTTPDRGRAEIVAGDVRRTLGADFSVWVEMV